MNCQSRMQFIGEPKNGNNLVVKWLMTKYDALFCMFFSRCFLNIGCKIKRQTVLNWIELALSMSNDYMKYKKNGDHCYPN